MSGNEDNWDMEDNDDGWGEQEDDGWGQVDDSQQIDSGVPPMEKETSLGATSTVYTVEQVESQIPSLVAKANDILCRENTDEVIAILRFFDWNQRKMEEQWFDQAEALEKKIGLVFDKELLKKNPDIMSSTREKNSSMCSICFIEFDDDETKPMSLKCGHEFCTTCWLFYLKDKVKDKGEACVFTKCPQLKCNLVVPHSLFLEHLADTSDPDDGENYYRKYLRWHCKQFTEQNQQLFWCPQKGCDMIIVKPEFSMEDTVACTCGYSLCLQCKEENHIPASCDVAKVWIEKEASDGENVEWLRANTKPCPKCHANIEKNQGCNHMVCYKCTHQFCWLCLADDQNYSHQNKGCNDYKKRRQESEDSILQSTGNEILKYRFYWERYNNHQKSKEICIKQISEIKKKMKNLSEVKKYPSAELEFLEDTATEIIECRQLLKWTYCVSFFSEKAVDTNQLELFKFQQQEVEQALEKTHQLLESDLSPYLDTDLVDRSPFYKFRSNLINLKEVLHQQRLHMMANSNDIIAISEEKEAKAQKEQKKKEEVKMQEQQRPSILTKLFAKR